MAYSNPGDWLRPNRYVLFVLYSRLLIYADLYNTFLRKTGANSGRRMKQAQGKFNSADASVRIID
jgi:hypothetical protein